MKILDIKTIFFFFLRKENMKVIDKIITSS